jgi:hypothetical protein
MKKTWTIFGGAATVCLIVAFYMMQPDTSPAPTSEALPESSNERIDAAPVEALKTTSPIQDSKRTPPESTAHAPVDDPVEQRQLAYERSRIFKAVAMEQLPLLAVIPHNPLMDGGSKDGDARRSGRNPKEGEVWIRLNAANSREYKEIMAQTADLYRQETLYEGPVTVVLWVGGRPWAQEEF